MENLIKNNGIGECIQSEVAGMNSGNYLERFRNIAKSIIKDYCILCGKKVYRFAEIEFYYYNKEVFNEEWNHKTYARDDKAAGDLFFHYSGVDICFDSYYSQNTFGGILIRSLVETTKKGQRYITGPLRCVNEILNSCASQKQWPKIEKTESRKCKIGQTNRYGINYKNPEFEDSLCFYDKSIENIFTIASWDYNKGAAKNINRYYNRFK